jgi:hypothetical protein
MVSFAIVGSYTLDTLQIYFAWDDDLYTYFKERGFGQSGFERKTLPIVYSDNCQSTTCVPERKRKYVLNPKYFGKTLEELDWKSTERETEPIITSETPRITVSLSGDQSLEFRIHPNVDGREQYHLEYSTMAAFGRLYTNWAIPVLRLTDFKDLLSGLQKRLSLPSADSSAVQIHEEEKQAQRERMYFVEVPLDSYKFSIGEFQHAQKFLLANGFDGILPSLVFKNTPQYLEKMQPILKVGFVHTMKDEGFEMRKPQIALKIAQPKVTISKRGKRCKSKGMIVEESTYENYFTVPAEAFTTGAQTIINRYSMM